MKDLTYHEADEPALADALDLYAVTMRWNMTSRHATDAERELAKRNLASIHRLQEKI